MVYLIKGRAGSGKTRKLREILGKTALEENNKPILLIPEQFSFETERAILKQFGPKTLKNINVFGFPRMAYSNLANSHILKSKIADFGIKNALISEALLQLHGKLEIYGNLRHNSASLSPLVGFFKELQNCGINSDELNEKLPSVKSTFLKNKLSELDLINESYKALLSQSYFDDGDLLSYFNDFALETKYFKGKTVFVDSFRSFSFYENKTLEIIMSQGKDVYFTLCTEGRQGEFSSMRFMDDFERKLRTIAAKCNAPVSEIICTQNENAFSKDISILEKALYKDDFAPETGDSTVKVIKCSDIDDECRYVALQIKKLLRSGEYRCRDIAVIERSAGTYKTKIINQLKHHGIPVFDDSRRPLENETLFLYVNAICDCIANGFSTEKIMCYLKTGLTKLTLTQISDLEKYAVIWDVKGSGWQKDFTMNPDGFGNEMNSAALTKLENLNKYRKTAVIPLIELKKQCEGLDGMAITKCIYDFLSEGTVRQKLFDLCISLENEGFLVEAGRVEQSWNILMNILDSMANLTKDKFITLKRWFELFTILVSSGDSGEIPQGLDEVIVGSADRIRTEKTKVCFLVGVNKDEFPLVHVSGGVLTDSDRALLIDNGLQVNPPFESALCEERFIAYCAVTAASQRLYMTYKTNNGSGVTLYPSELITTALSAISHSETVSTAELPKEFFIESTEDAFSVFAENYHCNSSLKSTLGEYLKNDEIYKDKLNALYRVCGNKPFSFENSQISTVLFGKDMHLSASKIDYFYNCPFSYFLRYGLKTEPLTVAALDPSQSGTIIHYVLENVLKEFSGDRLFNSDNEQLKEYVSNILRVYLEEKMGGFLEKSKRFLFLYNRLVDISLTVIERIVSELRIGSFVPVEFELYIGGEEIPPYETALDDGSVKVTGSVDRVDLLQKDGIKYIRVIDYKTGKKDFKLSDLLDGINIQMVLYLMAIIKNGGECYGQAIPAGVLYLPSRIGLKDFLSLRSPTADDVNAQRKECGRLSGMVLDSPVVLNGMGVEEKSGYFPVSFKKDGSAAGNIYSQKQFSSLSRHIDNKIKDMGNFLHKGYIPALPWGSNSQGDKCIYCPYKDICGREFSGDVRERSGLRHSGALKVLEVDGQ